MTVSLDDLRKLRRDLEKASARLVEDVALWSQYTHHTQQYGPNPNFCSDWYPAFVHAFRATGEPDPRRMGAALDAAIARAEAEAQAAAVAKASAGEVSELLRQILEAIRKGSKDSPQESAR